MRSDQQKTSSDKLKRIELFDWFKVIIFAVAIAFFTTQFIFSATSVDGTSMENTLHDEDRLFVWKLGTSGQSLKRGDIIVFHAPDNPEVDYIKRVVAFPHEYVQIEDGLVYINGKRLDEPYINTAYTHTIDASEWYIDENELFVLGDNRVEGASRDSRTFGPIQMDSIVGCAFFRFYPWSNMGGL